jgi:sortase A
VDPDDISELKIEDGYDYCTLVTCTPYGVNTHRLLVRGVRIETAADAVSVAAEAVKIPSYLVVPGVGIPLTLLVLILLMIYNRRRKPRKTQAELLEELKNQ